ncbi:MAG: Fic family protein [Candidatus Daviesbacteria bacterium]|nr:Fic family protein [Candidatus Daviesbacteria bacterium]
MELNNRKFPHVILAELEKIARAVSTYASTSIEGNPLPLTEVKKILKSKPTYIRDSEREVLNYNQALQDLNKHEVELSLNLILLIQNQITIGLLPKFASGKLRKNPVIVNNPKTNQIIYLPPDAKDIKTLMEELIKFVQTNKDIIDPLILAGIFHKQMVIIHPFIDGNGRTARLATKVLLAEMGLNTFNLFSFENYYNKNITKYFQTVGEFNNYYEIADKIDFTLWLEYFTEGIIDELLRVRKLLPKLEVSPLTQLKPYHLKILELIKNKGFITNQEYGKSTSRARSTRALDLHNLIKLGLIKKQGKAKATYYILA